ncbi:Ig-like domain-containing protein [Ideonella livida]|uniref:Big-1 domain-containing protein n=1 Tax=Ideonella livida TaxID=2707176 RepID=A0A7C9PHU5_9BURK|nr:Ig-like domain-containing protein [Ideonella livida]NDY92357.1 hypothetical protein [Ideonella livida]
MSSTTVTAASPVTVTAKVVDSDGDAVAGAVVNFSLSNELATLSAVSGLTNGAGEAVVTLSPAVSQSSGAGVLTATTSGSAGSATSSVGFQLTASGAEFVSIAAKSGAGGGSSASQPVAAYGQTTLTVNLTGVSELAPATVTLTSTCVVLGKATMSPPSVTTTTNSFSVLYTDNGCGASLKDSPKQDLVTATLGGSGDQEQLALFLETPTSNAIEFVSASPATIYLKGSGLAEASTVVFKVNDTAGTPLPNQKVTFTLSSTAGGITLEDQTSGTVTKTTNASGLVDVRVNSGTVPTPVGIKAQLTDKPSVSITANALAIGVGLPTQIGFAMAPGTLNIECYSINGVQNEFVVYAADRSGNPVPNDTKISFWAESGQIQTSVGIAKDSRGIAGATSNYACQTSNMPLDGRITVVAYAVGEESFFDANGNNQWDTGEPFMDMGDVSKDMLHDNSYSSTQDEYVSLGLSGWNKTCDTSAAASYPRFAMSADVPNRPGTCDGTWSGQVYVRQAAEIVASTSSAGLLWYPSSSVYQHLESATCVRRQLQTGPATSSLSDFFAVSGQTWFGGAAGTIPFLLADANPIRLNPMAAGTVATVSDATTGLTVKISGSPVPNTTSATSLAVSYEFGKDVVSGAFNLSVTSSRGLTTTYRIGVAVGAPTTPGCS